MTMVNPFPLRSSNAFSNEKTGVDDREGEAAKLLLSR